MNNKALKINLATFDFIKGVSMILVVLGHVSFFYDFEQLKIVYPVLSVVFRLTISLMPMFFIISGFGFKPKAAKKMLANTLRQLIVPYLYVMAVFTVLFPVIGYLTYGSLHWAVSMDFHYFLAFLFGIPKAGHVIFGIDVMHCSVVWFFLASFTALNLLNLILKIKKLAFQIILVGVSILIGYFLILRDINYYCIAQGMMALGYCYAGYLLKKYKILQRGINWKWSYVILLVVSLPFFIWGEINLCLGIFRLGLLDYFGTYFTAIFLIFVGLAIERYDFVCLDWVRKIGVYSYWILCVHSVEDSCMHWDAWKMLISNPDLSYLCQFAARVVIIFTGCFIIKKISQYRYAKKRMQMA